MTTEGLPQFDFTPMTDGSTSNSERYVEIDFDGDGDYFDHIPMYISETGDSFWIPNNSDQYSAIGSREEDLGYSSTYSVEGANYSYTLGVEDGNVTVEDMQYSGQDGEIISPFDSMMIEGYNDVSLRGVIESEIDNLIGDFEFVIKDQGTSIYRGIWDSLVLESNDDGTYDAFIGDTEDRDVFDLVPDGESEPDNLFKIDSNDEDGSSGLGSELEKGINGDYLEGMGITNLFPDEPSMYLDMVDDEDNSFGSFELEDLLGSDSRDTSNYPYLTDEELDKLVKDHVIESASDEDVFVVSCEDLENCSEGENETDGGPKNRPTAEDPFPVDQVPNWPIKGFRG